MDAPSFASSGSSTRLCGTRINAERLSIGTMASGETISPCRDALTFFCVFDFILGVYKRYLAMALLLYVFLQLYSHYLCNSIIPVPRRCARRNPSLPGPSPRLPSSLHRIHHLLHLLEMAIVWHYMYRGLSLHVRTYVRQRHALENQTYQCTCSVACHSTVLWTRTLQTMSRRRPRYY